MIAHSTQLIDNKLSTQRVYSIDAFRGITILVMIIVNELAGVSGLPDWMKHAGADDDTMTFVDVVFPAFLFIVGMSIPFAFAARVAKGDTFLDLSKHILSRTIGLLVLGVFLVNSEGGNEEAMRLSMGWWTCLFLIAAVLVWNVYTFENKIYSFVLRGVGIVALLLLAFIYKGGPDGNMGLTPQWWGILGLIGWAYLNACVVYLAAKGRFLPLIISPLLLLCLYVLGSSFPDTLNFIHSVRGHIIHTMVVLIGTSATMIVFDGALKFTIPQRVWIILAMAGVYFVIGFVLRPFYEISKIYATPTWALYSAVSCCVMYAFLYWIIDMKGVKQWATFFKPAAANPLLVYLLPYLAYALMRILEIWWPAFMRHSVVGVITSVAYAILLMTLVRALNYFRIRLQL